MKFAAPLFALSALLLTACQQEPARVGQWDTYVNAELGIRVDYPAEYSVTDMSNAMHFNDTNITLEGVRFRDAIPEGNVVEIYRTTDSAILDYLQQDEPFAHGAGETLDWQEFAFRGLGDAYGYVQLHDDGYYYVFEATWGPNNPVAEEMFRSLVLE